MIHVHLGLKRRDGTTVPVGRYALDIRARAEAGFATRREVGGSTVYDVQIYREPDGSYTLGVRRGQVTRLDAFAVR